MAAAHLGWVKLPLSCCEGYFSALSWAQELKEVCVFSCKQEKLPCLEDSESGCPQSVAGCRGSAPCSCAFTWPLSPAQEKGKHAPLALVAKEA